ncbi:MAG: hypothetical protein RL065_1048 [Bacteroidota bacterium]|jgi:two-component system response regulator NreC
MAKTITTILAEDHQLIIDELKKLLSNIKHINIVDTCSNGAELKESIIKHLPQFVITDINMPILNGIEICEWVKKFNPNTKIVLISMFYSQSIINKLKAINADGYLIKNSSKDEIEKCINSVINGNPYFYTYHNSNNKSDENLLFPKNYLSNTEIDVLKKIAEGYTNAEISIQLNMAENTIFSIREIIYKKLNTNNLADLVSFAQNINAIDKQ